jgi:predicted nucleotidyltransferase
MYERLEDRRRKDSADIGFILDHYIDAGNGPRLAEGADSDIMDRVQGDLQAAASMLLGRDMGRMAARATYDRITASLRMEVTSSSRCPLAHEIARGVGRGSFDRARVLLGSMLAGIEDGGGG